MKRILLRSLIIAIILGPLSAFVISTITYHHARKYDPPFTQDEKKRMDNMTVKEFNTLLRTREVKFPYAQWVAESIGTSDFWKFLGKGSLVPSAGIFLACICMGMLERRNTREVVAPPKKRHGETHGNPLA